MKKTLIILIAFAGCLAGGPTDLRAAGPGRHVYSVPPEGSTHASFDGGNLEDFMRWVEENIRWPAFLGDVAIQGRVVVSFVVDRRGKVRDIRIVVSPHELLSNEVVRILQLSPGMWRPGRDPGGKRIGLKYVIPVNFRG